MNYFRFTLIDYTFNPYGDSTVIDEPAGFDDFSVQLARDQDWHGIFSDYTINDISVESPTDSQYGNGFVILDEAYNYAGIEAHVILLIEYRCDGCDGEDCYQEAYRSRIDFGRSKRICGDLCQWNIVLEPDSCINTFRSRYDTKVDLDATTTFNGTPLDSYANMGDEIELPSKAIILKSRAETDADYSAESASIQELWIVPAFPDIKIQDLDEFSPLFTTYFTAFAAPDPDIDAYFTAQETNTVVHEWRLKGTIDMDGSDPFATDINLIFRKVAADGTITDTSYSLIGAATGPTSASYNVNQSYAVTGTINEGDRFLLFFYATFESVLTQWVWNGETESYIYLEMESLFDPTPAKTYLIHETLSHITESITDGCMKAKSSYYGRTDSQPYAFASDGCGGLRCLTNGLLIRQAVMQDGSDPKMTVSMKETFDGLTAIDAVGIGVEVDPATDEEILIVEQIKDFYTDDIILTIENNSVTKQVNENQHFAKILVGYNKWEAEEYNGLDEFLTKREYRTNLTQTATQLQLLSDLIASGYAIEITRRKGASTEDWRYDNDIFIICLERSGVYASSFEVEQGNISNDANIISPSTIYNYRISPVRNLLRWLWYILSSYRNPTDPDSEVKFTAGDGNFVAEGIMTDSTCRIESAIIAENADLNIYSLAVYADGVPIWYNETDVCTVPLAYDEFVTIQQNKYGLIGYTCDESTIYGWIKSMDYNLAAGEATFNLIPKR